MKYHFKCADTAYKQSIRSAMKIEVLNEESNDDGDTEENEEEALDGRAKGSEIPQALRDEADAILSSIRAYDNYDARTDSGDGPGHKKNSPQDLSALADALANLLHNVIRPLFSTTDTHPDLTTTGRKNLMPAPPSMGMTSTSAADLIFGPAPPWRNLWTADLIAFVIGEYHFLATVGGANSSSMKGGRAVVESQFHLLVPAVLNMIDDTDLTFKVRGCELLRSLCRVLLACGSDILRRTGLAEVFIDALKKNFSYLPTLTAEEESLALMRATYPAYLSLVDTRFMALNAMLRHESTTGELGKHQTSTVVADDLQTPSPAHNNKHLKLAAAQISSEVTLRTTHVTTLLRGSLLYSLSHLSTGASAGTTLSPELATFFIAQIQHITARMEIYIASHLQTLLPLLANVLLDPFVTSYPDMLLASIDALECLILACWPRIRDRWWTECLNAIVGSWVNISEEESDDNKTTSQQRQKSRKVKGRLQEVTKVLEDIVGADMSSAKEALAQEDRDLRQLFDLVTG